MIDHKIRSDVRQAIDDFLSDRIGADAFDKKLWELYPKTEDQTVKYALGMLWHTYSDLEDHLVRLDRREWGAVQRLALLLASDAEMQVRRKWHWYSGQLVAAATLGGMCILFIINFVLALLIGGIVSIALATTRRQIRASYIAPDPCCAWPFPSLGAIARTLRHAPSFSKRAYRHEIGARESRRPRFNNMRLPQFIERPLSGVGWCVVSPAVLIAQCLPVRISQEVFLEPQSYSAGAA